MAEALLGVGRREAAEDAVRVAGDDQAQPAVRALAEHDVGQHDDMLFAHALALMGLDQVNDYVEEVKKKTKPKTIEEILEWERATGKLFKKTSGFWDDKEDSWEDDMATFNKNLYD